MENTMLVENNKISDKTFRYVMENAMNVENNNIPDQTFQIHN